MDYLGSRIADGDWWISVVVVGIFLSVAGNLLTRKLDNLTSSAFQWTRKRSAKKREKFNDEVEALAGCYPTLEPFYFQMEMRARARASYSLLQSVCVGGGLIFTNTFLLGRVPRDGVSPQPGQAEIHGAQRATADSRVGKVSLKVCKPSSCM
jgi:hypothetical protein